MILSNDETLKEKLEDAQLPGYQVEFDPDEAVQAGAFVEDALSERDATASNGSADIGEAGNVPVTTPQRCHQCQAIATHRIGVSYGLNEVCERCAEAMVGCEHKTGHSQQRFDSDGCGYKVWRCDQCGFAEIDPL